MKHQISRLSPRISRFDQGVARPRFQPAELTTKRLSGRAGMARRQRILVRDLFACQETGCGVVSTENEIDHRVPLWAGGSDTDENLWTLCREHHKAKSDRETRDRAAFGESQPAPRTSTTYPQNGQSVSTSATGGAQKCGWRDVGQRASPHAEIFFRRENFRMKPAILRKNEKPRTGRKPFAPTTAMRRSVAAAAGGGMSHEEIAIGLGISRNTLEKHFAVELSQTAYARRIEALEAMQRAAKKGNVSAAKAYLALTPRAAAPPLDLEKDAKEPKAAPLGKKEQANVDAGTAQVGTDWETLIGPTARVQ